MSFPLLNIMLQYTLQILSGIAAGLLCKAYFATRLKSKIKDYQNDIINYQNDITKSLEKIIELEALNKKLEKRLKEMENYFSKDSINMNWHLQHFPGVFHFLLLLFSVGLPHYDDKRK